MIKTAEASAVAEEPRGPANEAPLYAALDVGTNNCRLLIAARHSRGFRIVDAYSRIVRLGEGVAGSGRLGDAAMERAIGALSVCADKIRRRGVVKVRAVATQACRSAQNGEAFIAAVAERTGLQLEIISPREEAQLAVAGCLDLLDRRGRAALVLDVGGGSTELSWVDLSEPGLWIAPRRLAHQRLPIRAWQSTPIGVVTLAERFPDMAAGDAAGYRRMVEAVKDELGACPAAAPFHEVFAAGHAHIIGTSGAITSLAGLHLGLRRYDRAKVDGLWMTRSECDAVAARLIALSVDQRAAEPCIGRERADLVLAGAAILQAVQEMWPSERVRVADRGLREGLLLSLMASGRTGRRRRRGGRGG
jgi:exopolyphosphatase/guanosine-5'-triphosphate,3'-diphosphate pyrophosphatase